MFTDWTQTRRRWGATLDGLAGTLQFRIGIAVLLASMHLLMFSIGGHSRLNLPFNSSPDEAPYFSDPDAPAIRAYPRQPHHWSRLIVSRMDAQHYIGTSIRGLTACPYDDGHVPDSVYMDCGLGWLPAWGTVGGLVSDATGIPDDITLVLMSLLCAVLINFMWTSKTLVKRIGRYEAYAALIAFNFYPAAFYVVTPYTEAATIALVLGGFIALANERWILSGLLVGAATALRLHAAAYSIALGCALLVTAWQRRKAGTKNWWRPLWAIPLCGWGQVVTMACLQIFFGNYNAFLHARKAFGDTQDWSRLWDVEFLLRGFGSQNADTVIVFGVLAILLLTWRYIAKLFSKPEATYLVVSTFVTFVLVVVAPHLYSGTTRYLMMCPLAFIGMGAMARRHLPLFVCWLALCALFYWHFELCAFLTQGDPALCPCEGKYEWGMPFQS